MKRYFSPKTNSFYIEGITPVPPDGVVVTLEQHMKMQLAKEKGKIIKLDENGRLIAVEPPPPPEPTEEEKAQQRTKEIQSLLTANDLASVRPLRAKLAGTATEADDARLAELEEQAQALRAELVTLNAVV